MREGTDLCHWSHVHHAGTQGCPACVCCSNTHGMCVSEVLAGLLMTAGGHQGSRHSAISYKV